MSTITNKSGNTISYCVRVFILLVIVSFVVTSCATTEGYKKIVQSWVGSNVNQLINQWGPPTGEYKMPNGHIVYTWIREGQRQVNTGYNRYTNQIQTSTSSLHCETSFTADASGKIYTWQFKGNNCVAEE